MAHLLGVENLRLTVGSRLLLDDVTLGIEDGTRVGVLGPNGAGKSTFLAALAGQRPRHPHRRRERGRSQPVRRPAAGRYRAHRDPR